MAKLGKSYFTSFAVVLILASLAVFLCFERASAQQEISDLAELVEDLNNSLESNVLRVEDANDVLDGLISSLASGTTGLDELEREFTYLESTLELQLNEVLASNNPVIRDLSQDYRQRLKALRAARHNLIATREDFFAARRDIEIAREDIMLLLRVQQMELATEIIGDSIETFKSVTQRLDSMIIEGVDIPSVLDCPGPGCPLGS